MIDITIITGLYGNGKSEFSLQYALYLKEQYGKKVYIGDLDVVNVYFRSRERTEYLKQYDIEVLGNILGQNANTDVPNFAPNFYNALNDDGCHLILDLAGSEVGLRMIPSFLLSLIDRNEGSYNFLYVFNANRDGNMNEDEFCRQVNFFNKSTALNITGIVNNSHLMEYTTCEDIIRGQKIIENSGLNLDIKYTLINSELNCKVSVGETIYFDKLLLNKKWN